MTLFDFFRRLLSRDWTGIRLLTMLTTSPPSPATPLVVLNFVKYNTPDVYLERRVFQALEYGLKPAVGHFLELTGRNVDLVATAIPWLLKGYRYIQLLNKYNTQRALMSPEEIAEMQMLARELNATVPPTVRLFIQRFPWSRRVNALRGLAFSAYILSEAARRLGADEATLLRQLASLDQVISYMVQRRPELQGSHPVTILTEALMETLGIADRAAAHALALTLVLLRDLMWGRLVSCANRLTNPNERKIIETMLGSDLLNKIDEYIHRATIFTLSQLDLRPREDIFKKPPRQPPPPPPYYPPYMRPPPPPAPPPPQQQESQQRRGWSHGWL